jgi:hypothetical protein
MGNKVLCPIHNDHEPSMTVYGKWAHCHVCKANILASELNLPENRSIPRPEPTNVPERIKYIKSLPTKMIRGLQLPYDNSGFYLVWPQENYYKRRNYEGKVRYIGPSGVKAPLLVCPGTASHLIVVEGELNALSLYGAAWGEYKIVSPGSAAEFLRHVKYYLGYSKITIIADYDAAGLVHGCQLKDLLLKSGKRVNLELMRKDFNQILQDENEEAVRATFERMLR